MNEQAYKSVISSGLASTLCLSLAVPLVTLGVLWTLWPVMAGIAGFVVLLAYVKAARIAIRALSELGLSNM